MDWGTRRKPFGAIVAWGSLAIFAVLTILGIAGLVMGLQPRATVTPAAEVEAVAVVEPPPVAEERLPVEPSFAEVQADPELQVAAKRDDMIASTFEELVQPIVVPASEVPAGAVATVDVREDAAPVEVQTAAADPVELRSRVPLSRNAAAWAIESEVPDASRGNDTALGYAAQPADSPVQVGDSSINVRSGPSQDNKRLFALAAGAEVEIVGKANGWVSITDSRGREGWVDATLLENLDLDAVPVIKDLPAAEPEKPAALKKVAGSGVTVRSGPGKGNKQLFNLSGGSPVTVLEDSKGWLKIKDEDGRTGWAYKSYIKG